MTKERTLSECRGRPITFWAAGLLRTRLRPTMGKLVQGGTCA